MKYALMGLTGLMALGPVALAPQTASAHHGGWGWGRGPGFGIYVGPATAIGATGMGTAIVPIITRYSYGDGPRWKYRYRDYD
jgi:hypothetical protein